MASHEQMMERLIRDDIATVDNPGGGEYLYNILRYGIKPYCEYTTEELQAELSDRDIELGDDL